MPVLVRPGASGVAGGHLRRGALQPAAYVTAMRAPAMEQEEAPVGPPEAGTATASGGIRSALAQMVRPIARRLGLGAAVRTPTSGQEVGAPAPQAVMRFPYAVAPTLAPASAGLQEPPTAASTLSAAWAQDVAPAARAQVTVQRRRVTGWRTGSPALRACDDSCGGRRRAA